MLTTGVHLAALISGLGAAMTAAAAPLEPKAYVSNGGPGTVSGIMFFPPSPPSVVSTTGVGHFPQGVAVSPDGTRVYVANMGATSGSGTLSVINAAVTPPSVTATVRVGGFPSAVAVAPGGTKVYVTNSFSNTVSVINAQSSPPAVKTTVAVGKGPTGVAVSPDGKRVIANSSANTVSVINATKLTPSVSATVAVGIGPNGVAVSPDGKRVYVANQSSDTVSVIDTTTTPPSVAATVAFETNTFPFQLVFSPDGTRVYVANAGGGVWVVDATANPPSRLTFITVGAGPSGIAITPDGAVVYVVNNGVSSVSLISTISNSVVATIPVGTNPSSVVLSRRHRTPPRPVTKTYGQNTARLSCHAARFGKMVEMVTKMPQPHRIGPQLDDEIMQFGGRHKRLDIIPARPARTLGIAKNLAAAA